MTAHKLPRTLKVMSRYTRTARIASGPRTPIAARAATIVTSTTPIPPGAGLNVVAPAPANQTSRTFPTARCVTRTAHSEKSKQATGPPIEQLPHHDSARRPGAEAQTLQRADAPASQGIPIVFRTASEALGLTDRTPEEPQEAGPASFAVQLDADGESRGEHHDRPATPLTAAAGLPERAAPAATTVAIVTAEATPPTVKAKLAVVASAPPLAEPSEGPAGGDARADDWHAQADGVGG